MAAAAGVLLLCVSSSVAAAFMMDGDKDKPVPVLDPVAVSAQATDPAQGREVFIVYGLEGNKGYTVGKNDRENTCSNLGAEVATEEQVKNAYDNGADWCILGWWKTPDNIGMPLQTSRTGCGQSGLHKRGAEDGSKSGVHCYGFKPAKNEDDRIAGFNGTKWSRYE